MQPDLPPRPIAKGTAGPSLIAQIVVAKYKDHLPLYRQSKIFDRFGVFLAESTLDDWCRRSRCGRFTSSRRSGRAR